MNEKSNYYGNYKPFLGGNDEPVIGHQQSYLDPKLAKKIRENQQKKVLGPKDKK